VAALSLLVRRAHSLTVAPKVLVLVAHLQDRVHLLLLLSSVHVLLRVPLALRYLLLDRLQVAYDGL
jgi:hypothetical protein